MGSNNILLIYQNGSRLRNTIAEVGQGPTGVAVAPGAGGSFVLNRFDASISVLQKSRHVTGVPFFDPTPEIIKAGRLLLFDTHEGSGQLSCASSHVDARADRLAWNLGNPAGERVFQGNAVRHPMKGPMRTTSLIGLGGAQSFHFSGGPRGDCGFCYDVP